MNHTKPVNFARADAVLARAAASGRLPGVVAAVTGRDGPPLFEAAHGVRAINAAAPMTIDTVFWLASMTKAVTSAAALDLIDRGALTLDAPAHDILPALRDVRVLTGFSPDGAPRLRPPRRPPTLRDLLTHSSGFGYDMWSARLRNHMKASGIPAVATCRLRALDVPLIADPGTRFVYGVSTDMVGRMVEEASGRRLEDQFRHVLFEPLGMTDTMFRLGPDQLDRLAPVHTRKPEGLSVSRMMVPPEPEFFMGGGGLYGTARDYLAFLRMIMNGGLGPTGRVLSASSVALMTTDQIPHLSVRRSTSVSPQATRNVHFHPRVDKGWSAAFMINRGPTAEGRSAGGLSWAGLANTYFWIDPAKGAAGLFLTQITPFFDADAVRSFRGFERAVHQALDRR